MIGNYEKSVKIYESSGQYGVYDAVRRGQLLSDSWQICQACDDNTPHEEDTCLVCGTQQEL